MGACATSRAPPLATCSRLHGANRPTSLSFSSCSLFLFFSLSLSFSLCLSFSLPLSASLRLSLTAPFPHVCVPRVGLARVPPPSSAAPCTSPKARTSTSSTCTSPSSTLGTPRASPPSRGVCGRSDPPRVSTSYLRRVISPHLATSRRISPGSWPSRSPHISPHLRRSPSIHGLR